MAARLLESAEPAARRFCEPTGLAPFADLSTWADDIRQERKETAGWHFIDIPLGAARDRLNEACGSSGVCVTAAIRRQLEVLRSASAGRREQAEALLFVIHFAGDLHQPLHAATNNDRGGNCLPVRSLTGARSRTAITPTSTVFGMSILSTALPTGATPRNSRTPCVPSSPRKWTGGNSSP
jgi:hypothetical protein